MGAADAIMVHRGLDYGAGEGLDIYQPSDVAASGGGHPVVLLWHGVGVAERTVLRRLAEAVAAAGAVVVVPDWRSTASDRGRHHLLTSLAFTRTRIAAYEGDPTRVVLAGWSRGARAGMGLLLHPEIVDGWQPQAFVGVAGGYGPRPDGQNPAAPTTGTVPLEDARTSEAAPLPVWLVHGTADHAVDIAHSRALAQVLATRDWTVHLEEVDGADHVSVVWADHGGDPPVSTPGESERARRHGGTTAKIMAEAVAGLTAR